MATEATFTVPSDEFPLGTVYDQLPDVTVELERIIPARDVVIPYFWVRGTEVEDVESAFVEHPGVHEIRLADDVEDEHLLRVEWALNYTDVLTEITLSLYHTHLPRLASEGLVTCDPDRELVEPIEHFEEVQPTVSTILDADPTLESPVEL
jgi:hypothetical protein